MGSKVAWDLALFLSQDSAGIDTRLYVSLESYLVVGRTLSILEKTLK